MAMRLSLYHEKFRGRELKSINSCYNSPNTRIVLDDNQMARSISTVQYTGATFKARADIAIDITRQFPLDQLTF